MTYAIAGAIPGGLMGYAAWRATPDRYGMSAVFGGTGAVIGFFLGAFIGFKKFMDMIW